MQNWIGGPSPCQAAYVPPPPDHLARLMGDLIRVTNSSKLDPVTLAAVVHAQFEAIHPYGDANGRLGRVLLGWVLARSDRTNQRVLLLYRADRKDRISRLIGGNQHPRCTVLPYADPADLVRQVLAGLP